MKPSKIYALPPELFRKLVRESWSLSDILKALGLHVSSGNYKTLKRRLKEDDIDYAHIILGLNHNAGKRFPGRGRPIERLLLTCKNPNHLKTMLLKSGLLRNECYKCGLKNEWQGESLSLQMDHINGNAQDNRLENLRILCPNCHSQTTTYAARNRPKRPKKIRVRKLRPTKIIWPPNDDLIRLVSELGYVQAGKALGVSDNAVRKRIRKWQARG